MTEVLLSGLRPEPLGSYLAALGVFRLVSEQTDAAATLRWTDEGAVLESTLDRPALESFFLENYAPTPLVAPWNKGSGFRRGGSSKSAEASLVAIETSASERLAEYRQAVVAARRIADDYVDDGSFAAAKEQIVVRCRSQLPDSAVAWLDAAVVLTTSGIVYPHLLGTGGNLGRLDLTANYHDHLGTVIDLTSGEPANERSKRWFNSLLDGDLITPRLKGAVGQFEPGLAGGVNSSTLDGGDAFVNPWQFILSLEGALLFASATARRLGVSGDNVAAMPFTVRPSGVGAPHLSETENAKGELWLPLWAEPVALAELRRLIGEGRLRWGGKQATDGIDAARAIAALGTDRGVEAFARVSIVERLGQSPLAVPAGRVRVRRSRHVALTGSLDRWLRSVRRGRRPRALLDALHQLDETRYAVATATDERVANEHLLALLLAVADVDRFVGRNRSLREEVAPCPPLDPAAWLPAMDDGTSEFAIAMGFAGLRDRLRDDGQARPAGGLSYRATFVDHLRPVVRRRARLLWNDRPPLAIGPRRIGIAASAAQVHVIHARHGAPSDVYDDQPRGGRTTTGFSSGPWLPTELIQQFVLGELDDGRIGELVSAMTLLQPTAHWPKVERSQPASRPIVPAWQLLAPFFAARALPVRDASASDDSRPTNIHEVELEPRQDWPHRMAASHTSLTQVCREALTGQRIAGLTPLLRDQDRLSAGVDGRRLAAALLLHAPTNHLARAVSATAAPPPLNTAATGRNAP